MEWGIKPGSSQEVENPGEECWDDKPQCLVLQKSKLDHEQIQMDGKKTHCLRETQISCSPKSVRVIICTSHLKLKISHIIFLVI